MRCKHVVALVMAAGHSRRFGHNDKRLASLADGQPLLATTLATVQRSFLHWYVVLRCDDVPAHFGLADDARVIRAPHANEGLGASLADGVAALGQSLLSEEVVACAVLLGDMPYIRAVTLSRLCQVASAERIVRPVYAGRAGHPVLFGRHFWSELTALTGDSGGREVLHRHARWVNYREIGDPGIHHDIDHRSDLARGMEP